MLTKKIIHFLNKLSINRLKDNFSKKFDKYDYNFKYDSLFQTYIISHIY